ncbi:fibroblast growth factor 4A-like [Chanos chanos]|uniref:Fibroblast growth factor n=1 Tax=Chanos chanos TaxID=29144 RepID=A0A6J2WIE4_CHACN|nr:fibroblast growth factor 4A-like [Chanos chanos]
MQGDIRRKEYERKVREREGDTLTQQNGDADSRLSGDLGGRLRRLWQLSMKESKQNDKVSVHTTLTTEPHPHPVKEIITQKLLYCRVGIGYHLQILSNGSVGGVHEPTEYSLLRLFAMKRGVVGIRGVKSGLYLCMNEEGMSHGESKFSPDCLLKENLEENHYTTYSSLSHPGLYLALSHRGQLRRGNNVGRHQACTHFLPRKVPINLS